MSTTLNPDTHSVKQADKAIKKAGGYCPYILDVYGEAVNCKHECCSYFNNGIDMICPMGKYIKTDTEGY
jgi:hypothetical protein